MATNLTPEQLAEFTSYLTPETLNQIYGGLADPTLPGGFRPQLGYEWDSMEAQIGGGPGRATIAGYSGPIGADDMYNAYSPTGEFLGRYQADNNNWKALLPIAMAFGGQFLFGGGLGGAGAAGAAGTTAAGLGPIELAIAAGEGIIPVTAAQTATAGLTAAQLGALGSGIGLSGLGAAGAAGAAGATTGGGTAAGTGAGTGTTAITAGLPATITKLLTNPSVVSTLLGATLAGGSGGGGGGGGTGMFSGPGSVPTQGMPTNSPEYFNQVQGFLNQYLPGQMPTQSQYLSSWYNNTPGSYMPPAAAPSGGGGMMSPTTPVAAPSALPPQRADVVTTGGRKPARKSRNTPDSVDMPAEAPSSAINWEALNARGITSPEWLNVSTRDLIEKSGYTVDDKAALDRAFYALYGNVGANMDTRDWAAIMASDNPLAAAEAALARMYSDPAYREQNNAWLAGQGYPEASAPLTYAQMVGRAGASYTPTAAEAAMIAEEINKITSTAGGGYHQAELAGPAQVLANAGYAVDPGYKPYLNQPLQTAQPVNYGGLSAQSSASDIAQAYKQFTGGATGDTVESRNAAIQYLQNIGIDPSRIGEAYSLFRA